MLEHVEVKVDPEAEHSAVQRRFKKLNQMCSVEKRAAGIPQLAPQEKQMSLLAAEMQETKLCIRLATQGRHRVQDARAMSDIKESIIRYEAMEAKLVNQRGQKAELDVLIYLAGKMVEDLNKKVPSEADEVKLQEDAANRLRLLENRLDQAIKRFSLVETSNLKIREEIHMLLVKRNNSNVQWDRAIRKLVKGKEYLMDILEIATTAFAARDECCRKLDTLKWRGLFQLNKDIAEMQYVEGELNDLAKLEEFLRVKSSKRICEADEKEEEKRLQANALREKEIDKYDALIEEIMKYAGTYEYVENVIKMFQTQEMKNHSLFIKVMDVIREYIAIREDISVKRQNIFDQYDMNMARVDKEQSEIARMTIELEKLRQKTHETLERREESKTKLNSLLTEINELVSLVKCNVTPLLTLLGNHKKVTAYNTQKFLNIMEIEIKSLIEVVYGAIKPPAPTPLPIAPKSSKQKPVVKVVADPYVVNIRPNKIENLVPYQPCAYCVEDYIMNLVQETPAVPADRAYIDEIFHLGEVNTKFGIYTLTIPTKRHSSRNSKELIA